MQKRKDDKGKILYMDLILICCPAYLLMEIFYIIKNKVAFTAILRFLMIGMLLALVFLFLFKKKWGASESFFIVPLPLLHPNFKSRCTTLMLVAKILS